jgi:hypothetical protein
MRSLLRLFGVFTLSSGVMFGITQIIRISPSWPWWVVAAVFSLVMEALVGMTRYERSSVTPGRAKWMLILRVTALCLLTWMLIEPTWVCKVTEQRQRQLMVLVDDSASMQLLDDGATGKRIDLAEQALARAKVIETLGKTSKVRTVHFARSVQEGGDRVPDGWADSTDLAAAMNHALEQIPPDELAGAILLSDGRHNRPDRVEDTARRFGILDAPIGIVAVGSSTPPRDAAIVSVDAPEAIHLGDRMRVSAKVKFDGYKGKTAKVLLCRGDKILEEREISIPQEHHREDLRFAHLPEEGGVGEYRIEIADLVDERFDDNNQWEFETSITDARTNVLLVDSHPRWEFRYLRNLFYGRDKSVHLQYVLLHPDQIAGQEVKPVAASAARPFGEAQATQLPRSEEEWRKFDVIILGDLEAKAIDAPTWQIISRCVNERAALLVMIAGPRSMPHALVAEEARALVPAEIDWGTREYFTDQKTIFRWQLTAEGQQHPITQQASGRQDNASLWAGFAGLTWRHPIRGVKAGAEILLTQAPEQRKATADAGADLNRALADLAERRQQEVESALLVTRRTGKGKVALLLTDRTWRLREGAGDVYHHRFWGNLVRWGAGPTLRAGGQQIRMGTDQLTYTPDDPITVTARLRGKDLAPMEKANLQAEVLRDGAVVRTVSLREMEESNGLYEVSLPALEQAGRYEIRLQGEQVAQALQAEGGTHLQTSIRVVGTRGPVELSDTTLHLPLLETIAGLSGGKVVSMDQTAELLPLFQRQKREKEEVREISLWDHWTLLLFLFIVLSVEWVIRRGAGLP